MIIGVAKAWDRIMPVGTGGGQAGGGSNTDERSPHANRSGTRCSAERGLCLRLLDARGGAQPRVHLRSHRGARYARNIEIRSRNNKRSLDQTIACSTVDEFVRLTI